MAFVNPVAELRDPARHRSERVSVDEFRSRLQAQGVCDVTHYAVVCPVCETVQSVASLIEAGAGAERAERMIGFSCEGRLTNVGTWPAERDMSAGARARRKVRGCNYTLGGLFQLHELEAMEGDEARVWFRLASPEQARQLQAEILAKAEPAF